VKTTVLKCLSAGALFALAFTAAAQPHGHLYIGAASTNAGTPLSFVNGIEFAASNAYVKYLFYTNGSRYSNFYQGNITLTGYARTPGHPEFNSSAAAWGAWLHASIAAVEGPPGGAFAFWESLSNSPTIHVPSGGTSTNLFRVSETAGEPGGDPYGHIHGRRFTATAPGLYKVTFQAWDLSTNGPGGGPIHTTSQLFPVYFEAGLISSIQRSNNVARITYGSFTNWTFTVETTTNLLATNTWSAIGVPRVGDDYFQTQSDTNATNGAKWYRVRAVPQAF